MKLIELEINNLRGIINLPLKPNGKNFVILGPNGSGKSTIVDAIDFLLTGQISRFFGKGTKDIKFDKHGPHINFESKDAMVRGLVEIPGFKESVEIKRFMDEPKVLICTDDVKSKIIPLLDMASRGQHVLTRREISSFVTADASTRSQQIQRLLKITEVENIRKKLVKVRNDLKKDLDAAQSSKNSAEAKIKATIQESDFDNEKLLKIINENREILDGEAISETNSTLLKKDINPPTSPISVNIEILGSDIQNLREIFSDDNKKTIAEIDKKLRELKAYIVSDPRLKQATELIKLTELGLELVGETGNCPLCGTHWALGDLKKHLEEQLSDLEEAAKIIRDINSLSISLNGLVKKIISSIQEIMNALETLKIKDEFPKLQSWLINLQELSNVLEDALENYPDSRFSEEQIQRLLAPDDILTVLDEIYSSVKSKMPEPSSKQTAWDLLTRLEANLEFYEESEHELENVLLSYKKAEILVKCYEESMDSVLGKLYAKIKDRFIELYKEMHGEDEGEFNAYIIPEKSGLDFKVDFHGKGTHPPHALHSEGHQDSMGICLYLALAESITEGVIDLIILDDVISSIDSGHRRELCSLLAKSFPDRQFLITTHDKVWAKQLNLEGVVNSKGLIELYNWTLENGPCINSRADMWSKIDEDLEKNDVPAAAAKLRRGSEDFFSSVCHSLRAKVTHKPDGRHELGDLLPEAMNRYNKLLNDAKDAANSWNNREEVTKLVSIEKNSKEVFNNFNTENWAVNANVHYNDWVNFTLEDFEPVVEAYQDLYSVFQCDMCEGIIHVSMNGGNAEGVRCNCGSFNWNLNKRS